MKNKYSVIAAAFVLMFSTAKGQLMFQSNIGMFDEQYGRYGQQTSDGGYVIAGSTKNVSDVSSYLVKTDSSGAITWTKVFEGGAEDRSTFVQQTSDGGYILCGYSYSFTNGLTDAHIIKTKDDGDTLWSKHFGGSSYDGASSIRQTSDGGYIATGNVNSFGAGNSDAYLLKLDSNGNTLWAKGYGGTGVDYGASVQQTSDGGFIVAGYTNSFGAGGYDVLLIKTSSAGDTLWSKTYGGSSDEYSSSVQQTGDGGYIIAGNTGGFGAGDADVYLIRTNSGGDNLWTKTYGGPAVDAASSVQQTEDAGFIIAGYTISFGGGMEDVYVIRTDSNGDTLWTRASGGTNSDYATAGMATADGGYVVIGTLGSFGVGYPDVYLIKTDANGYSSCNETSTGTEVGSTATQVASPALVVSSLSDTAQKAAPAISSGGSANIICLHVDIGEIGRVHKSINIFPNPFAHEIKISSQVSGEIAIFDLTGKRVIRRNIFSENTIIDTKDLSAGFYTIQFTDGRTTENYKVVKQ